MNELLLVLLIISNLALIFLWLRLFNRHAMAGRVQLDLAVFMAIGWFLYGVLPGVDNLTQGQTSYFEIRFSLTVSIALLAMIIGAMLSGLTSVHRVRSVFNGEKAFEQQHGSIIILGLPSILLITILLLLLVNFYVSNVFGDWFSFLFKRYGIYEVEGVNSLTSATPLFIVAMILVVNSRFISIKSLFARFLIVMISIVISVIFFMGGARNLGVMMILALIFAYSYRKNTNFYLILMMLLLAVLFAGSVAVYREYGIVNVLIGVASVEFSDVTRYMFAINQGEFGTMFRVSRYVTELDTSGLIYFPGISYFISPIINLMPQFLMPDRPDTIAVEFTKAYWGGAEDFMVGLGFSPIVEAMLNFNYFWPTIFICYGFIVKKVTQLSGSSILMYFSIAALSVASLNFFRIDFALYFKFSIMIAIFSILIYKTLNLVNRISINRRCRRNG